MQRFLHVIGQIIFGGKRHLQLQIMCLTMQFNYLNDLPGTDTHSFRQSAMLSEYPPTWSSSEKADLASFKSINTTTKYPVLTVSRLGDWHGTMKQIDCPIQIIDAIRDTAFNTIWQYLEDWGMKMLENTRLGARTPLTNCKAG